MTATAIYASHILTPQEQFTDCVIVVEAGRITGIGHRDEVHIPPGAKDYVASGMTVIPGFVDVHIHGAGGHDVMEARPDALDRITSTVARFGTTSIVATTVTAPVEETCRSLEGIAQYIRSHENAADSTRFGAEILGMHLEGPFINKARRGVHRAAFSRGPREISSGCRGTCPHPHGGPGASRRTGTDCSSRRGWLGGRGGAHRRGLRAGAGCD